jgi:hypothetical protein
MENQLSKKQKDLEKECNLEFLYDETLNTQTELQYARKELERSIEQDFKGAQIVLPTKLKMK